MILVDGDVVRYRCAYAAEKTRYYLLLKAGRMNFDNAKECNAYMKENSIGMMCRGSEQEVEPVEHALHSVKTLMASIKAKYPLDNMVVFFSCPTEDNWRTTFFPQYKANRKPRKATHDKAIHDYMWNQYHCEGREHYEADDLIGIWAAEHKGSIIATNDKDMDQIAGVHYDFTKGQEYTVLPHEASYVRELQTVMGDTTDNIPGIQGVGGVTAAKMLEVWGIARTCYLKTYATVEAATYWFLVNRAMVSLPTSTEDVEIWQEHIRNARKAFDALPPDGEADMPSPEGSGNGEPGTPETKASCA